MKKYLLNSFLTLLLLSMFAGCGGGGGGGSNNDNTSGGGTPVADTTAPVIALLGTSPVSIDVGSVYNDAGATASDNIDGDITTNIVTVNPVNTGVAGSYTVTYNVADSANNAANEVTRTVTVVEENVVFQRGVVGTIHNYATGEGISGISVTIANQTVTTDANGAYQVPVAGAANPRVVVTASGNGFTTISKITSIGPATDARSSLDIEMLPVAFSGTFNPTQNFTALVPNSTASVAIGAGSLVDASGTLPVGDITAALTPINPALDINLMPGDMTVSGGDPLASYGALTVAFSDASGSPLNLSSGQTATIRIPVSNRGSTAVPATIPLYYFDEDQGVWVQEGAATLSADGTYYEGSVGHFSTWNADYLFDSISINGCVQDFTGNKIANALVNMEGFNYNGMTATRTDANGNFIVTAMKNGISLVVASTSNKVSNTIKVGDNESTATDVTVSDCLILGDVPLTVRLTWGVNPTDLDTHVFGPSDYHIWWLGQGSLASEPHAQLDVDDITSYGPEVFTALSFPQAGTYHYAIHHFSGSSTISASPARVELTLEGQTTVYFPPTGQAATDKYWNVFDIIVDTSGNITIVDVNTWSPNDPTGRSRKLVKPNNVKN